MLTALRRPFAWLLTNWPGPWLAHPCDDPAELLARVASQHGGRARVLLKHPRGPDVRVRQARLAWRFACAAIVLSESRYMRCPQCLARVQIDPLTGELVDVDIEPEAAR